MLSRAEQRWRSRTRRPCGRLLFGLAALSAVALSPLDRVAAEYVTPLVSPDCIEDAPSTTRLDPYPTFDNFAWRAFIALNWPSLVDDGWVADPSEFNEFAGRLRRI